MCAYHAHMKERVSRRRSSSRTRRRKAPTNLSLRIDLVRKAKALGLNLSEVLEAALEAAIRDLEQATWLDENQQAIRDYNAFVAKHGVFGDDVRQF